MISHKLPEITSYDDLQKYMRDELGFCGCSAAPEALELLWDVLRLAREAQQTTSLPDAFERYREVYGKMQSRLSYEQSPGLATWFLYLLDHHRLVEHASNVAECFISPKGNELLDAMDRYPRPHQPEDDWTSDAREVAGGREILRIRSTPPAFATNVSCPRLVEVVWRFSPDGDGWPAREEDSRMGNFEIESTAAIEESEMGFLALAGYFPGARKWLWYVRTDFDAASEIQRFIENFESAATFQLKDDPNWERLEQLRSGES